MSASGKVDAPAAAAERAAKFYAGEAAAGSAVAALRAWRKEAFGDAADPFLSDETLWRYAVARNGDVEAAKRGLLDTLAWRPTMIGAPPACSHCTKDTKSHCFKPLGLDTLHGRPIVYASQPRAGYTDVDAYIVHMVNTLERLFADPAVHFQWVWLIDFNGWGWSHAMQAKVGINTLSAFGSHMPERLGRIILLNPPRVLDMLMAVIKPFIDARTSGKIVALHLDAGAVAATLAKDHHFPADVAAWVQAAASMDAVPGNLPPLPAGAAELQITHVPPPPPPPVAAAVAAPAAGSSDASAAGGAAAAPVAGDASAVGSAVEGGAGTGSGGGDAAPP